MKYTKIYLSIITVLLLSACSKEERESKTIKISFDKVCVDGVQYLVRLGLPEDYRVNLMSPHFKSDGTLHLCAVEKEASK